MKLFLFKNQLSSILFLFILLSSSFAIAAPTPEPESTTQSKEKKSKLTKKNNIDVTIIIDGLNEEQKKNALAYLELRKNLDNPHFSEAWLRKLHNKAEQNIKDALQPFGYYQVTVNKTLTQDGDKKWRAEYHVTPGEPVKVTVLDIVIDAPGGDDSQVKELVGAFSLQKGSVFNHAQYEKDKDSLLTGIGRLGYANIKTHEHKVIIDPKINSAEIHIHLESGPKFYLGQFTFHQDEILKESLILKYLDEIQPGDPQSQEVLLDLQDNLLRSGYFSKVDVKPDFTKVNDKNEVPIDIFLEPSKRHKFSFGAGYDTEIEANISMRWQHRRINQYGHNSDVSMKLSAKKSFLRGAYWIPFGDPKTDKIGIIPKFETEDTDTTDRDTFDLEVGYWFEWRDWTSALFTEYKREDFITGNDPEINTELLSIGGRMERNNYEETPFPRSGWSLYGEVRGAGEGILSDISYYRLHLKPRIIFPVAENDRLILRGELGLAETSDFELYPSSLRFYAGGDQSVRGYKWKALGPKDDEGNVVGGRNVVTGSIEYNHKMTETWVIAGFVDAGNAYNSKMDKVFYGGGFGARYIAPIGLIRADLGFPLQSDDDIEDDKMVFYFGFEVSL